MFYSGNVFIRRLKFLVAAVTLIFNVHSMPRYLDTSTGQNELQKFIRAEKGNNEVSVENISHSIILASSAADSSELRTEMQPNKSITVAFVNLDQRVFMNRSSIATVSGQMPKRRVRRNRASLMQGELQNYTSTNGVMKYVLLKNPTFDLSYRTSHGDKSRAAPPVVRVQLAKNIPNKQIPQKNDIGPVDVMAAQPDLRAVPVDSILEHDGTRSHFLHIAQENSNFKSNDQTGLNSYHVFPNIYIGRGNKQNWKKTDAGVETNVRNAFPAHTSYSDYKATSSKNLAENTNYFINQALPYAVKKTGTDSMSGDGGVNQSVDKAIEDNGSNMRQTSTQKPLTAAPVRQKTTRALPKTTTEEVELEFEGDVTTTNLVSKLNGRGNPANGIADNMTSNTDSFNGVAGWADTTIEPALGPNDRINTTDIPEEIEPMPDKTPLELRQEGIPSQRKSSAVLTESIPQPHALTTNKTPSASRSYSDIVGWPGTTTEPALGPNDRINTTDVPEEIEPMPDKTPLELQQEGIQSQRRATPIFTNQRTHTAHVRQNPLVHTRRRTVAASDLEEHATVLSHDKYARWPYTILDAESLLKAFVTLLMMG